MYFYLFVACIYFIQTPRQSTTPAAVPTPEPAINTRGRAQHAHICPPPPTSQYSIQLIHPSPNPQTRAQSVAQQPPVPQRLTTQVPSPPSFPNALSTPVAQQPYAQTQVTPSHQSAQYAGAPAQVNHLQQVPLAYAAQQQQSPYPMHAAPGNVATYSATALANLPSDQSLTEFVLVPPDANNTSAVAAAAAVAPSTPNRKKRAAGSLKKSSPKGRKAAAKAGSLEQVAFIDLDESPHPSPTPLAPTPARLPLQPAPPPLQTAPPPLQPQPLPSQPQPLPSRPQRSKLQPQPSKLQPQPAPASPPRKTRAQEMSTQTSPIAEQKKTGRGSKRNSDLNSPATAAAAATVTDPAQQLQSVSLTPSTLETGTTISEPPLEHFVCEHCHTKLPLSRAFDAEHRFCSIACQIQAEGCACEYATFRT